VVRNDVGISRDRSLSFLTTCVGQLGLPAMAA
jgi:hypothetical protein